MQLDLEKPVSARQSETEDNYFTVVSGANKQRITLGANETMTVGDVRKRLGDVLNIAPTALAVIGDETVEDDRVMTRHEELQFIKHSGTKG